MEDEFVSALAIDIRMGILGNLKNWVTKLDEASRWKCLFQIYVNDVGVGAPTLASYIWNKYSKESSPDSATRVATKMAKSPKTGLCSWINTIFFKNNSRARCERSSRPIGVAKPSKPVCGRPVPKASHKFERVEQDAHEAAAQAADKILRKCASKIHNSCYNSSNCDDWDPLEQYKLFYWAGRLCEREAPAQNYLWGVIMDISVAFPKNVQENINALKCMFELDPSVLYIIQCLIILSQPNEWMASRPIVVAKPSEQASATRSVASDRTEIPSYAYDITTETGRMYLEKIGKDRGWEREYMLGFGVRNYYRVSCKVTNSHVVPVQCYREFAISLETSDCAELRSNGDIGCKRCCRSVEGAFGSSAVYQRIRILSSIRKLPKNTITALSIAQSATKVVGAKPLKVFNIRNEILLAATLIGTHGEGFVKIPGHYETLVDIVGGVTEKEVKQKYKLDKIKRYLQMNTLPALALRTVLSTDATYSLIYETGYFDRKPFRPDMALPSAQRSLTRILLFQWLMGVKSEIVVIGGKVYSMDEKPAKVEKPVLPPWAYTPIGIDKVREFLKKTKALKI